MIKIADGFLMACKAEEEGILDGVYNAVYSRLTTTLQGGKKTRQDDQIILSQLLKQPLSKEDVECLIKMLSHVV